MMMMMMMMSFIFSKTLLHKKRVRQKDKNELSRCQKVHSEHTKVITQCGARTHDHKIKSLALCRLS
jgi:hypothetical protein